MRTIIFDALFDRMRTDKRLFMLTADMGFNLVERFKEAYPDRFVNVGIAEQNMVGIAAGLCNAGFRPFCYTISNFYLRAFERITVGAPVGQYRVRFIHGPVWAGPEQLFGRGTVQDEVLGVMPFTASIGHILDLRLGPDSGLVVRRLSSAPESLK